MDPSGLDYLLVGGSNSTKESMEKWKQQLIDEGLLEDGEDIYILWDNDEEFITGVESIDIEARYSQLNSWFMSHAGVKDLKIIAHSEGACTVGTLIFDWLNKPTADWDSQLNGERRVYNRTKSVLDHELRGVFLVECLTGISDTRASNYNERDLWGLGDRLSRRGIIAANIFNSCSIVNLSPLPGWMRIDVASWNDPFIGIIPGTIYHHTSAKKDSLSVIKTLLNK